MLNEQQAKAQEFIERIAKGVSKNAELEKAVGKAIGTGRQVAEQLAATSPKRETERKRDEVRLADKAGKAVSKQQL